MLAIIFAALLIGAGIYLYRHPDAAEDKAVSTHAMSDEIIKQRWRELGFYCELDDERKTWRLIGSRAGLLYFPDLLLGYVNDPQNATDGQRKHYGPYGSLEVMTWREPGLDSTAIRGSIDDLTRLAEYGVFLLIFWATVRTIYLRGCLSDGLRTISMATL